MNFAFLNDPAVAKTIYSYAAGRQATNSLRYYRTADSGSTWSLMESITDASNFNWSILCASPDTDTVLGFSSATHNILKRSTDKSDTFSDITLPSSVLIRKPLHLGGGKIVAVGNGCALYSTDDGASWTASSSTPATSNNWVGVAYNGSKLVAVGTGSTNRAMYSDDYGVTWKAATIASKVWSDVTYANGLFIAVNGDAASGSIYSSTNGTTWTSRSTAAFAWQSVVYGNSTYVTIASDSRTYVSTNGTTWTAGTTNITTVQDMCSRLIFDGTKFITVIGTLSGGTVFKYAWTSTNGTSWTNSSTVTSSGSAFSGYGITATNY